MRSSVPSTICRARIQHGNLKPRGGKHSRDVEPREGSAQAVGPLHEVVSLGQRGCERLLDEDVAAGLQGHPGHRVMIGGGNRYDQRVATGGERLGIKRLHGQAVRHLQRATGVAVGHAGGLAELSELEC